MFLPLMLDMYSVQQAHLIFNCLGMPIEGIDMVWGRLAVFDWGNFSCSQRMTQRRGLVPRRGLPACLSSAFSL